MYRTWISFKILIGTRPQPKKFLPVELLPTFHLYYLTTFQDQLPATKVYLNEPLAIKDQLPDSSLELPMKQSDSSIKLKKCPKKLGAYYRSDGDNSIFCKPMQPVFFELRGNTAQISLKYSKVTGRFADQGTSVKKCTNCFRNNKSEIELITAKCNYVKGETATNFFICSECAEIEYLNEDSLPMVKLSFADEGPHEIGIIFPCLNSCKTDLNRKIGGLRDLIMQHGYGDLLTTKEWSLKVCQAPERDLNEYVGKRPALKQSKKTRKRRQEHAADEPKKKRSADCGLVKVITLNESDKFGKLNLEVPYVTPQVDDFIKIECNIKPEVFGAITKLIEATGGNFKVLEGIDRIRKECNVEGH